MERFGPGGNFPTKVVHLKRWLSLTGQSSPTENCRSIFRNPCFQPATRHHAIAKMADGTEVNLYEYLICKLKMQDLKILLMHSCTQGSGTALHLDLLCSAFYQFLNPDILLTFPNVDDVFPCFSLCSV